MIVKPGGTGKPDARHFGQVGALAAEQGLHRAVAVGLPGSPRVDEFMALGGGGFLGGGPGLGAGLFEFGFGGHFE